jgi:2-keto-3-deoxy-L-rhamnonate aldolase RhmA
MCSLGHYMPAFIQHAAVNGFDCIWLDLEHRHIDDHQVQALIAYGHLFDIDIMVRPSTTERGRLYRYLEDGAAGLMVPHVSTVEKAEMLIEAVKFPPIGNRGLDGAGLDGDFYQHSADDYVAHVNRETFLVVQIETPQAVKIVDSIAAVRGVDGLFVGPGDLSLRLRQMPDAPSLDDCCRCVAEAAHRHRKAWGIPVSSREQLQEFADRGAQILARGGDYGAMLQALRECGADFQDVAAKRKST